MIIVDCDKYRINETSIRKLTETKTDAERVEMTGKLAVATGVPIIVVVCYLGEMYGFTEGLNRHLKNLIAFYHVDDIVNCKEALK